MKKYGLIGFPLKHSFSQKFFTEKFQKENIEAEYLNFEIDSIDKFLEVIKNNKNLCGLNVTIPYKEKIIPFLNELDKQAKEISAINVIKINRVGGNVELKGFNSDLIGFQKSIEPLIDKNIHKKALILGTGGASKAVLKGLENLNIKAKFVSRNKKEEQFIYEDLNKDIFNEYKIIINASPIGTFPKTEEAPNIPYKYLTTEHVLYDLVYNPPLTKFLELGREKGSIIKNGYEMLKLQALAAWNIWNEK